MIMKIKNKFNEIKSQYLGVPVKETNLDKLKRDIIGMDSEHLAWFLRDFEPCKYCIKHYEDNCKILSIPYSEHIEYCSNGISEYLNLTVDNRRGNLAKIRGYCERIGE